MDILTCVQVGLSLRNRFKRPGSAPQQVPTHWVGSPAGNHRQTTNLPFDEWTEAFGSEWLTGGLLDRLTHHVHILEMNGESYRLKRRQGDRRTAAT